MRAASNSAIANLEPRPSPAQWPCSGGKHLKNLFVMAFYLLFVRRDSDFASPDVSSPELLSLIKEKLSGYIQKCFLASGLDTEESIAYMDVHSVKTMKPFVLKQFSHDPSKHSKFLPTSSGSSFEFPPGHKVLILRFIKQVKEIIISSIVKSSTAK